MKASGGKGSGTAGTRWRALLLSFAALVWASACPAAAVTETDLCVYGATVAGITASVQAARMGASVVLLEPGLHFGGMTAGGLGATDIGNKQAIGGMAREFYQRVASHYAREEAWVWERRKNLPGRAPDETGPQATMWTFEPHVARHILFEMLNEARVPIYFQQALKSVTCAGGRITQIDTANGRSYRARMFIDASYEGDLMAQAGVRYTVGREANRVYGETLNGIRGTTPKHQFSVPISPYAADGTSLLPLVQADPPGSPGEGDRSVQAYNFRLCYTREAANRLPHPQPAGYDPARYELLARYLEARVAAGHKPRLDDLWNPTPMPNGKTDCNNDGPISTDYIGGNYGYPDGDPAARAATWQAHKDYTQGYFYFLATSPRVPSDLQREVRTWGPAADEFAESGHWPPQLYVREARRMISDTVMNEHHCRGTVTAPEAVGLAAYTMDSHNCRRIVKGGHVENEGDVQVGGFPPYPIGYAAIIPARGQCGNLAVPVCLSASHIAYGSIRMEPVFMILGQSAATAAVLALREHAALQDLDYASLRSRLLADKQVLEWKVARSR